jgi:hypothetical protein
MLRTCFGMLRTCFGRCCHWKGVPPLPGEGRAMGEGARG